MNARHILTVGGRETACGLPVGWLGKVGKYAHHVAGHDFSPGLCADCRKRLAARPQLFAAIVAELRADGLAVPELARLEIRPRQLSEAQRIAMLAQKDKREARAARRKDEQLERVRAEADLHHDEPTALELGHEEPVAVLAVATIDRFCEAMAGKSVAELRATTPRDVLARMRRKDEARQAEERRAARARSARL
jgi:hypothetical protein